MNIWKTSVNTKPKVTHSKNGVPTYGCDLAQAVKDGYLVDYVSVESKLKFIEQGIVYDELSEEDKDAYEKTFENEHGEVPESIGSSALNTWIFNEDTIKQVLHLLMTNGIKIDYGQKIGKTIIFAKNHDHAEKIFEVFRKEYPHLPNFAVVIDNRMTYAQSAIDEFSEYLQDTSLEDRQIYFVNQVVEYIVQNGMKKDLSVLQDAPFTDKGSVVEIFTDMTVWMGIRKVIDSINANATA